MQINDIFDLEHYDEAYRFVCANMNTTIIDLGDGQYQIVKIPKPNLEELKFAKRAEINAARDAAEQGGFFYMGKIFDSDIVSCIRIQGAAQSMQAASMVEEVPSITWTCKDNSTIELTAQELLGLSVALAEWSNQCHQKATTLKTQIENATSQEELEKITWNA